MDGVVAAWQCPAAVIERAVLDRQPARVLAGICPLEGQNAEAVFDQGENAGAGSGVAQRAVINVAEAVGGADRERACAAGCLRLGVFNDAPAGGVPNAADGLRASEKLEVCPSLRRWRKTHCRRVGNLVARGELEVCRGGVAWIHQGDVSRNRGNAGGLAQGESSASKDGAAGIGVRGRAA